MSVTKKRETVPVDPRSFLDKQTLLAYLNGETASMLASNRDVYTGSQELTIKGVYFCLTSFIEDDVEFSVLSVYKFKPTQKKTCRYAFGAFNKNTGEIEMFFGSQPVANTRKQAIKVYAALKEECSPMPFFRVFAMKQ